MTTSAPLARPAGRARRFGLVAAVALALGACAGADDGGQELRQVPTEHDQTDVGPVDPPADDGGYDEDDSVVISEPVPAPPAANPAPPVPELPPEPAPEPEPEPQHQVCDDHDFDGICDEDDIDTGIDSDLDGLDDYYDPDEWPLAERP
jgi:hypothetical protein